MWHGDMLKFKTNQILCRFISYVPFPSYLRKLKKCVCDVFFFLVMINIWVLLYSCLVGLLDPAIEAPCFSNMSLFIIWHGVTSQKTNLDQPFCQNLKSVIWKCYKEFIIWIHSFHFHLSNHSTNKLPSNTQCAYSCFLFIMCPAYKIPFKSPTASDRQYRLNFHLSFPYALFFRPICCVDSCE
jgi:hypothetical protein